MVEQLTLNQLVLGSSPSRGTNFAKENEQVGQADTLPTQETPESIEAIVKWPKKVKHRNQVLARIYRPCTGRDSYRVAWSVNAKRMMKSFSQHHWLFEAVKMKTEVLDQPEIDFYRVSELRTMLDLADADLRPYIALAGLAGLRREEILRLDWADVWRVKGKIEMSARIAKGRKRRLVDICPALALWLNLCRKATGPVWGKSPDALEEALSKVREDGDVPARRNGLRHSFITFHMALRANENLTAAEAGNSPQMIHDHYRALVTRREAVKRFAVKPAKAANVIPLPAASRKEAH